MAVINSSYGFVFVHVPKTAGTSVSRYLARYNSYCDLEIGGTAFGEEIQSAYRRKFGLSKHSPAFSIKAVMGDVSWNRAISFAFVRNPYSRFVSTYNFLCGWEGCPNELREELLSFDSLDDYVASEIWKSRPGPDGIFFPQVHWTSKPGAPKEVLLDFILKVEELDTELPRISKVINLREKGESETAPSLNRSESRYKAEDLGIPALEAIGDHYRNDFDVFGYQLGCVN